MHRRTFVAGMLAAAAASPLSAELPREVESERMAWPPGLGYSSSLAGSPDESKWLHVDLGASRRIDGVRIYPSFQRPWDTDKRESLPLRFRIDVSDEETFRSSNCVADHTASDYKAVGDHIQTFRTAPITCRYVRLTVTKCRPRNRDRYQFQFAKIEVLSGETDYAQGQPVTDSENGYLGVTHLTRPRRPEGEGVISDNPKCVTAPHTWRPADYSISAPKSGVRLDSGVLKEAFDNNVDYLLTSFTVDDLLRQFRQRAGKPIPASSHKPDPFWEEELAGSNAGRFLMGAGNAVRWNQHPELRTRIQQVITGISECRQINGYIMAYPEDTILASERGGYTRAWVTHGLIEAGYSGYSEAFRLLRGYYDWFNRCDYLPLLKRGAVQGVQGMIANTRMYHTPDGRYEDIQTVQQYFQEDYWMEQLGNREEKAIWTYPYDEPHCYLLTALEAYFDLYRATGDLRYYEAALGGWELFHSLWQHIGGSIAICEGDVYRPSSYHLHRHTGEFCGSVFMAFLSQRFHLLDPDQERYVGEIEKSIYNVALANQGGGRGIRYHAQLVGRKASAEAKNTCCEGQGTRLLGALPEFIFSISADGVYVNLYSSATIEWKQRATPWRLQLKTAFPFASEVELHLSVPQPESSNIRIRVPGWATSEMAIKVNGHFIATGRPGTYVPLNRVWSDGDNISFTLPMEFRLTRYTGEDRIVGEERYALQYGPILMALVGNVDEAGDVRLPFPAKALKSRLRPRSDKPLHIAIDGSPQHEYLPYWLVNGEAFSCFPVLCC